MKILNREFLLSNLMNDENLAQEIMEVYVQSAPELLGRADSSLAEGDMDAVRINLHSLAGASANVGAERLAAAATAGEKSAIAADIPNVKRHIQMLREGYQELIDVIEGS